MTDQRRVPLSILDLAVVSEGGTSATALAETTQLAQEAEALGYIRFWVAEHHNMPTVASTNPAVLIAHLAASTEKMHIGSGGVMLPNHASLTIAEQFAMLEALHPGRIDLGIGRAPGTDPATAAALRRAPTSLTNDEFPGYLIDLMGLLGDQRGEEGMWNRFSATPVAESSPTIVLLGSSGYSAQLAGYLGLPFAYAHHFDTGGTLQALSLYHENFQPSPILTDPYTIVTANVLTAETDEDAEWLAASGQLMTYAIRTGRRAPLMPPEAANEHPDLPIARTMRSNRIVGAVDTVVEKLEALVEQTVANELMIFTAAHGVHRRVHSLKLLAEAWHGCG